MFEWFADLPAWLKYGVALAFLGVSTALYFSGIFWPYGWGAGGVLLCFAMFLPDN